MVFLLLKASYKEIMKILDKCTKNSDNFSWKELNCYHKPFATAFKTFDDIYFDAYLLLVSYLSVYAVKNCANEEYTFPEMYENYLEKFFEIKIEKVNFNDKVDMAYKIKKSIDIGAPIVVPVDIIELKYNPMYKIENHYKNMVIKGYDFSRDLIYILDNSHDDFGSSTILSDFVSDIDEMYNMAISYGEFYEQIENGGSYFYSIKMLRDKVKKISYLDILNLLSEILAKTRLSPDENEKIYIRNPELKLLSLANSKTINRKDIVIDHILMSINFKKVFNQTLYKIISKFNEDIANTIKLESEKIEKSWNEIKFKLIFKISRKNSKNKDIQPDIEKVVNLEKDFYTKLGKRLESIKVQGDILEKSNELLGYCLKNNNNADILNLNNEIIIKLSENKTYDIWTGSDDAVQLICTRSDLIESFSVKMDIEGELGDPYQCGIIIKLLDGKKILFGSTNGNHISIFVPDLKDKFEIYHQLSEFALKNVRLKIKINKNIISFINTINGDEVCVDKMEINSNVAEIGMFVKSWIKTKCQVCFSDMEIIKK